VLIAGLISLGIAFGLLFLLKSQQKKLLVIQGVETSTVELLQSMSKSMTEQLGPGSLTHYTEIKGKILCDEPLVSEMAGEKCVYYSMRVEREYEETYHERDSQGRNVQKVRTRTETVSENIRSVPFYVQDATGKIKVNPVGAAMVPQKGLSRYEPAHSAGITGGGVLKFGSFSIQIPGMGQTGGRRILGYRMEENLIPVGKDVYILGEATDRDGELCMAAAHDKADFIISAKSEEELIKDKKSSIKLTIAGIILCGIAGVVLIVMDLIKAPL
jgi:hypothetical protein